MDDATNGKIDVDKLVSCPQFSSFCGKLDDASHAVLDFLFVSFIIDDVEVLS